MLRGMVDDAGGVSAVVFMPADKIPIAVFPWEGGAF